MKPVPDSGHRPDPTVGLEMVQCAISDACRRTNRDTQSVTLIAVSKTIPTGAIEPVISAGHSVFGENRVQETKAKWPALRNRHPALELHLVGPLQTNKVREAIAQFDVIHSVDRHGLCEAIARESNRQARHPKLFVQVNTGAEPQKAGVLPGEVDRFLAICRETFVLNIVGLMCIPPVNEPPKPHFALLAEIAARNGLKFLSMGMSTDFAQAIEFGATHVRVGSAIFGSRLKDIIPTA